MIDASAFNVELDREKRDAAHLAALRRAIHDSLMGQFATGDLFADEEVDI